MSQIILDFGSGNTCKNDLKIIKRMINELAAVDTHKHEVIIKWQLFQKAGDNIPLQGDNFYGAYEYAKAKRYKTTASVFDLASLHVLLQYEVPFIKIANRRDLDWLIGEVPRKIPMYISIGDIQELRKTRNYLSLFCPYDMPMACVSEYPARLKQYQLNFSPGVLCRSVSDHTTDFTLWHKYKPQIIEWHYVLEHDSNNLDGGLFARTPKQLKEIL